jgi:two-component system CheB/CheR fusion protein
VSNNDVSHEEFGVYDAGLNAVLDIVSAQMGIDFSQYKPTTLQRRIQRRMALHKFRDVKDYVRYVKETPKEAEDLYRDIRITVTNFFRDPDAFESLKNNVFVPLFADRDLRSDLRIWVPGCATGEEPYSIAIALTEYLSQVTRKMPPMEVHIFATDVNEASLAKARLGIYSQAIVKDLTPDRLHRFFVKQDGMQSNFIRSNGDELRIRSSRHGIAEDFISRLKFFDIFSNEIYDTGEVSTGDKRKLQGKDLPHVTGGALWIDWIEGCSRDANDKLTFSCLRLRRVDEF